MILVIIFIGEYKHAIEIKLGLSHKTYVANKYDYELHKIFEVFKNTKQKNRWLY